MTRRAFLERGASVAAAAALASTPFASAAALGTPAAAARAGTAAGNIRVWQTTGADRHAARPELSWQPATGGGAGDVQVLPQQRKQEILGFGGAFTDAATYMFSRLSADARAALFHELFDPSEMGFSVGRSCVGSSDYSTKAYAYDESAAPDPGLKKFSIAHDRRWILPMLREARHVNPDLFLLSSPWSPPAWMKDNHSMLGGTIRRRYLAEYANYLTRFVEAYAAAGVHVDAITTQNEVDTDQDGRMPQCTWPQEAEVEFVGQHLGPAFVKAGLRTKIWLIDHNYNLWGRALAELEDPDVRRFADGIAWHGYLGSPEKMTVVHDAYPDKNAYWTEGGPDYTDPKYQTDWTKWAGTFSGILRNWARCIIAWNLALDEHGKPNIGPFNCGGVVTIDRSSHAITRSGQFWAFAHYSRHVRRGARVLDSTGAGANVTHVAFENPDGGRVLVLANAGSAPVQQRVIVAGQATEVSLPADSVTTLAW